MQQNIISKNVKDQKKVISGLKEFKSRRLNDEIIDITVQIKKINKLSIFWNEVGNLDGN
tara:strand:+ start:477 stop:653 length:177 start_codon:yes stop_codon:yes gene_type:complete